MKNKTHHTKFKGDIGVSHVIFDLTKKGFCVSLPITEHAPYDLIATKNKKVFRIQVKFRTLENGTMKVHLYNSWGNTNKKCVRSQPYSKHEVDYFAITNGEEIAYVKYSNITSKTDVTIRVTSPQSPQKKSINMIADFQKLR